MLTLFVGPSGVGKTTLMQMLCENANCKLLPNFTTRPLRLGETARNYISEIDADMLHATGKLQFTNEIFGNLYGVLRADFEFALNSDTNYLFDIHHTCLQKLAANAHKIFFLLPARFDDLRNRVISRRSDKFSKSLVSEVDNVKELAIAMANQPNVHVIQVIDGQLDTAMKELLLYLSELPNT